MADTTRDPQQPNLRDKRQRPPRKSQVAERPRRALTPTLTPTLKLTLTPSLVSPSVMREKKKPWGACPLIRFVRLGTETGKHSRQPEPGKHTTCYHRSNSEKISKHGYGGDGQGLAQACPRLRCYDQELKDPYVRRNVKWSSHRNSHAQDDNGIDPLRSIAPTSSPLFTG